MNTKTKWGHWFWGLFFLACAVILVASKMGWFSYHLSFWTLVFTFVLAAAAVKSLAEWSFTGAIFSLAFMSMLYAKPLGITSLVPWTVLGVALLLSIGLSLVFQPLKRKHHRHHAHIIYNSDKGPGHHNIIIGRDDDADDSSENTTTDHESTVEVNVRMGSAVRYIQSENFQQAVINMTVGEVKVYFDGAKIVGDHAAIEVNGNVGQIDLYIPEAWDIQEQLDSFIVDISENGHSSKTGPKVYLVGNLKVGELTIHYI
ncbi:hypothetical protein ACFQ4L_02895 [Lapidilactobacillus mulanensis]|uniref:LiaF transmembrane domain-containing protein n=1 Tax=Lapidilactobacillus mulanensis TaxID=2485999 RepID=A0ABW4DMB9_9LACO|nr:hypothetical protein [Lapidilactobacillus mulanensis]